LVDKTGIYIQAMLQEPWTFTAQIIEMRHFKNPDDKSVTNETINIWLHIVVMLRCVHNKRFATRPTCEHGYAHLNLYKHGRVFVMQQRWCRLRTADLSPGTILIKWLGKKND